MATAPKKAQAQQDAPVAELEQPAAQKVISFHAEVAAVALAAQRLGDHARHGALHSIEALLGEIKMRINDVAGQLSEEDLALIERIKSTL